MLFVFAAALFSAWIFVVGFYVLEYVSPAERRELRAAAYRQFRREEQALWKRSVGTGRDT